MLLQAQKDSWQHCAGKRYGGTLDYRKVWRPGGRMRISVRTQQGVQGTRWGIEALA